MIKPYFEYLFIFDYFDQPLFFIAQVAQHYELYYCLNKTEYLQCRLQPEMITFLFSGATIREILTEFQNHCQILAWTNTNVHWLTVAEFEAEHQEKLRNYFPTTAQVITYDYLHQLNFKQLQKIYPRFFSEVKGVKQH